MLGVRVAESNSQVARYTDIIVLAVKPYTVAPVLEEVADGLKRDSGKPLPLLISIAAGVPTQQIYSADLCTASHADAFCSYRRDGAPAGRLAAVIRACRAIATPPVK